MKFYDELNIATQKDRELLYSAPMIQDALAGKIDINTYVTFLSQAYHHVRHTVPLLMACGSRLSPEYEFMKKAITEYIEEEYGHEQWILNDIQNCGFDPEQVKNSIPHLTTDMMVRYAYHQIDRKNPVGFFGMVFVLEGTSTALATQAAEVLKKSLGLPNKAFSYLLSHGSLDLEHVQFFEELVNQLKNKEDHQSIIQSAKDIFKLYGDIFRAIPQMESFK
jgi:pyrroloquinoline quinone (PQQ) biosynthesis protein C